MTLHELELQANQIRQDIIKMLVEAGSGHSGGPLGLTDIFTALYFEILQHDPKNPSWDKRDIMLLSNGHCVPVQYATMANAGYFDREIIQQWQISWSAFQQAIVLSSFAGQWNLLKRLIVHKE